jgi:NitT/TauT family transport system substrate-binding protein
MLNPVRRALLGALVGAAALIGTTAAAEPVKLGVLRLTSHAGNFVAVERGYFAEEGLEVELEFFQAAGPMAVAIASGDIDFGVTAISGALINLAEKGAIKVIGGALTEEPGIEGQKILASNAAYEAGLTSPAALGGHSFGITQTGSSFHYMASQIAAQEGIAMDALRLTPLQKVGAVIGALKSGQIDAWPIVPHIAGALDGSGAAKIIGSVADYIPDYQVTTVFTSADTAANRRDLVQRFLRGYSKGVADYNAALVDRTEGDAAAEDMTRLIHLYVYTDRPYEKAAPSIQAGAMRLQPNAKLNVGSVRHQLEWFQSEGLVGDGITLDMLVDASFVESF